MLIEVKGNGIVSNAHYQKDTNLCSRIIINTISRWRTWDYIAEYDNVFRFGFYSEEDSEEDTCLDLIPENDEDIEVLNRVRFINHNKDQIWIVFLKEEVYNVSQE
jgi:hypothetical protein